jgi:hypothetical protein
LVFKFPFFMPEKHLFFICFLLLNALENKWFKCGVGMLTENLKNICKTVLQNKIF